MSFYSDILSPVFGSKPKTAKWKPLDYGAEQQKGLKSNISAFPEIKQLGDLYQSYLSSQMESLLPGFSDILKEGASTSKQMLDQSQPLLRGELPQDVKDQIYRSDAYQALSGGYAGSQMSHNLTARDLGLTSLDLMGRGASLAGQGGNAAQRWASLARGETLDPSTMFVSPQQTAAFDLENKMLQQQSRQYGFNVDAAPDPVASGISNTIMSLVGAYLGGGMGGGKGGQAGVAQYDQSNTFNAPISGGYASGSSSLIGSQYAGYPYGW